MPISPQSWLPGQFEGTFNPKRFGIQAQPWSASIDTFTPQKVEARDRTTVGFAKTPEELVELNTKRAEYDRDTFD